MIRKLFLLFLILVLSAGCAHATDPVSHYKFNEGSGLTTVDETGFINLTVPASVDWITGTDGSALQFNNGSTDEYLNAGLAAHKYPVNFTIMCDYKYSATDATGINPVIDRDEPVSTGYGYTLRRNTGNMQFIVRYGDTYITAATAIGDYDWHHWAASYGQYNETNTVAILYKDGIEVDRKYGTNAITYGTQRGFYILGSAYSHTPSTGCIDDVRIYSSELSSSDVYTISGADPDTGDLPNPTGETIIDENTTWDGVDVSIQGLQAWDDSNDITFTIKNSTITTSGTWYLGENEGDTKTNLVIENSTITFSSSSGVPAYYLASPAVINQTYSIYYNNTENANSSIRINDSLIQGLPLYYKRGIYIKSGGYYGSVLERPYAKQYLYIDNVTFKYMGGTSSVDGTGNAALSLGIENDATSYFNNVSFVDCCTGIWANSKTKLYNFSSSGGAISFQGGILWDNAYMNKSAEGLYNPSDNAIVTNSYFDSNQTKLNVNTCSNVTFENNTVLYAAFNAGDIEASKSGDNNTFNNNTMRYTGVASRTYYTKILYNTFFRGMPSGGNVPLRVWGNNFTVDGNYINEGSPGIEISAYYSYLKYGNHTIQNNLINRSGYGININREHNNLFINNTIIGSTAVNYGAIQIYNSTEQTFRDTSIVNSATYDIWMKGLTTNVFWINTYYNQSKVRIDESDVFLPYYYLDVLTQSAGLPVTDASISVTNTVDENYPAKNINCVNTSTYTTDETGRTPLPSAPASSGCILDYIQNSTERVNQTYTLTASKTGFMNVVLDNVNPSASWYRSTPGTSKHTITAIFNESAETHLTGYSPSDTLNNYGADDTVEFQVWTSEDVDSVTWTKDGETVASDVLTYETIIGNEPITVEISGTDTNGDFSKTWTISTDIPVAAFTANVTDGTAPKTIQFTDASTQLPTSWAWDFNGDSITDSTEQNPVYTYESDGNYTVSLTVENEYGSDTETKTGYIKLTNPYVAPVVLTSVVAALFFMFARRRW